MDGQLKKVLKSFLLLKILQKDEGGAMAPAAPAPVAAAPVENEDEESHEGSSHHEDLFPHSNWLGTIAQPHKKKKKKIHKAEELAKEDRPIRAGQVSSHGKYIADYHQNGNLVWHYHPDIARSTDRFISQNRDKYLTKIKPQYREAVSDMFDHVLKDRNRHVVAAFDKPDAPPAIRARHLKSLMEGQGHVKLTANSPNDLTLTATRHGLGSNYNEQHAMKFSNRAKLAASELYKSEMKRYLEDVGHFEKSDWKQSYTLYKDEPQPTTLYHYSRQPGLKSIDPKQMGTGTPGSFNRRFDPSKIPDFPHTSFHYVKDEPEDIVRGGARSKYTLQLNPEQKLYDLSHDKEKLVADAVKENNGAWNYENVLNKIKNAGYYGTWASRSENPIISNTVQLFHQHPVHKEEGV